MRVVQIVQGELCAKVSYLGLQICSNPQTKVKPWFLALDSSTNTSKVCFK